MAYQDSPQIAAIDDMSGALSSIRESVAIIAARNRDILRTEDLSELSLILDACDRIQTYHLIVRADVSRARRLAEGKQA